MFNYNDGVKYDGDWNDGNIEGKGIMNYLNGESYEGDWK